MLTLLPPALLRSLRDSCEAGDVALEHSAAVEQFMHASSDGRAASRLVLIIDYDLTMSCADAPECHHLLRDSQAMPLAFREEIEVLFAAAHDVRHPAHAAIFGSPDDPDHPHRFWMHYNTLLVKHGISSDMLDRAVADAGASQPQRALLRPGVAELLIFCQAAGVLVLILSAGIEQVIRAACKHDGVELPPCCHVLTNRLKYDDATGRCVAVEPSAPPASREGKLHLLSSFEAARSRDLVLMIGDKPVDARVSRGLPSLNTADGNGPQVGARTQLSFGFFNDSLSEPSTVPTNLADWQAAFDLLAHQGSACSFAPVVSLVKAVVDPSVLHAPMLAELEERCAPLPKCDLHTHLDGSLSSDFIARRATARGIELPCPPSELRSWLHEQKRQARLADGNRQQPGKNWGVFDFCNRFLQSAAELSEATEELVCRFAAHGVRLLEVRFCPTLHCEEGLSEAEAVEATVSGFRSGAASSGVVGGIIVCALRSHPPDHSLAMVALARRFLGLGVVGFDIAGDEGNFGLSLHGAALDAAVHGTPPVPVTVHAGEWPSACGTLGNISFALDRAVSRLGHDLTLAEDPQLMRRAVEAETVVECCLTGNVGSARTHSFATHPIRQMFDAGVRVCINCDNVLLSGTAEMGPTPSHELARLVLPHEAGGCGFTWAEARQVILNGARASFTFVEDPAAGATWLRSFAKQLDEAMASRRIDCRPDAQT